MLIQFVSFEFLTAVLPNNRVFLDITLYRQVNSYWRGMLDPE